MLLALLAPSLSSARHRGRLTSCAANLRALFAATEQYRSANAGLLPLCDSPTVIMGSCTPARVRAPFEAIAPYLDVPLPPFSEDNTAMRWPPRKTEVSIAAIERRAPFACPADNVYSPRLGFGYDFVASAEMLNMLTNAGMRQGQLDVSRRLDGQDRYGGRVAVWGDLHIDAHAPVAPAALMGRQVICSDGGVVWSGAERRYSVVP